MPFYLYVHSPSGFINESMYSYVNGVNGHPWKFLLTLFFYFSKISTFWLFMSKYAQIKNFTKLEGFWLWEKCYINSKHLPKPTRGLRISNHFLTLRRHTCYFYIISTILKYLTKIELGMQYIIFINLFGVLIDKNYSFHFSLHSMHKHGVYALAFTL